VSHALWESLLVDEQNSDEERGRENIENENKINQLVLKREREGGNTALEAAAVMSNRRILIFGPNHIIEIHCTLRSSAEINPWPVSFLPLEKIHIFLLDPPVRGATQHCSSSRSNAIPPLRVWCPARLNSRVLVSLER